MKWTTNEEKTSEADDPSPTCLPPSLRNDRFDRLRWPQRRRSLNQFTWIMKQNDEGDVMKTSLKLRLQFISTHNSTEFQMRLILIASKMGKECVIVEETTRKQTSSLSIFWFIYVSWKVVTGIHDFQWPVHTEIPGFFLVLCLCWRHFAEIMLRRCNILWWNREAVSPAVASVVVSPLFESVFTPHINSCVLQGVAFTLQSERFHPGVLGGISRALSRPWHRSWAVFTISPEWQTKKESKGFVSISVMWRPGSRDQEKYNIYSRRQTSESKFKRKHSEFVLCRNVLSRNEFLMSIRSQLSPFALAGSVSAGQEVGLQQLRFNWASSSLSSVHVTSTPHEPWTSPAVEPSLCQQLQMPLKRWRENFTLIIMPPLQRLTKKLEELRQTRHLAGLCSYEPWPRAAYVASQWMTDWRHLIVKEREKSAWTKLV